MPSPTLAAGGIVIRLTSRGHEMMIVHRPRYNDWSIPKGKVDLGEGHEDTALREVAEETALRCELGRYLGEVTYLDEVQSPKLTRYWLMTVVEEQIFSPTAEIDARQWITLTEAASKLSRVVDRDLVAALAADLTASQAPR